MAEAQPNEHYKITDEKNGIIHKLDMKNKPDKNGLVFKLLEEKPDGYIVTVKADDPSQPSSLFFIDKKYFKER
jgi:hypothetical protein